MINIKVKPSAGQDYSEVKPGMYNATLEEFGEWSEGVDKNGTPYFRASLKLKIVGGDYDSRLIYDSLFINERTPEWVLGNFLACFDESNTEVPASELKKFVGKTGRITTKNEQGTDGKVYTKVKNYIKPESATGSTPWDN